MSQANLKIKQFYFKQLCKSSNFVGMFPIDDEDKKLRFQFKYNYKRQVPKIQNTLFDLLTELGFNVKQSTLCTECEPHGECKLCTYTNQISVVYDIQLESPFEI